MISNKALALAALGAAIGAITQNKGRNRASYFSKDRLIGSALGFGAGLAVGETLQAFAPGNGVSGLGGLALSEAPGTPLKRQPIQISRTDAVAVSSINPDAAVIFNPASRPVLGDRILIG